MASPTAAAGTLGQAPPAETRNRLIRWLVPIGLGVVILLVPRPAGLTPAAWHYFALFAAVISALITERFLFRGSLGSPQTVGNGPARISGIGAKKPINSGLRNEAF